MSSSRLRPKAFRDLHLTAGQRKEIAAFASAPPITGKFRGDFEEAFRIEVALEAVKAGDVLRRLPVRRQYVRTMRKRLLRLTFAPQRAAAPTRIEIQRAALRYLRHCGSLKNFNITSFVRYVQLRPGADRRYSSGKSRKLSDHAIRHILKTRLGIVGVPGRKRKNP